ncbi:MAG: tRNA pseudouridine(55) synthase TruB [Candidatus Magasanikbacteria bacterium]
MQPDFLLINKPKDWTSHDVVGYLRKVTRIKKIGHAGTLDPFATGLLIVGIGREATKRLDEFKSLQKTYVATLKLGYISDTFDSTGNIKKYKKNIKQILTKIFSISFQYLFPSLKITTKKKIDSTLKKFIGKQNQIPPMYSAKKVNGKKLYELARKGIEIERKPCDIEISDIKILEYSWPLLNIEVACSSGTYIRTLAHDIGQKLGCGAYCEELERTRIGDYTLDNAYKLSEINFENFQNKLFV